MAWFTGAWTWIWSRALTILLGLLAACGVLLLVMKRSIERKDAQLRQAHSYVDTTKRITNADMPGNDDESIDYLKTRRRSHEK